MLRAGRFLKHLACLAGIMALRLGEKGESAGSRPAVCHCCVPLLDWEPLARWATTCLSILLAFFVAPARTNPPAFFVSGSERLCPYGPRETR